MYHTGRISVTQEQLDRAAQDTVTAPPPSSFFHTPLLLNSLSQSRSSSSSLPPTALLPPLQSRFSALTSHTTTQLHVRAQRILLQSASITLGAPALAWGAWAAEYGSPEVALGAGALGAVVGLRWGVGRWERAKKRWWDGWVRIGEGLERDLQVRCLGLIAL